MKKTTHRTFKRNGCDYCLFIDAASHMSSDKDSIANCKSYMFNMRASYINRQVFIEDEDNNNFYRQLTKILNED